MKRAIVACFALLTALAARADEPKNLKVLTGLSGTQLQRTMNFIRGSLGVHCDYCHVVKDDKWDFASDEKKTKIEAREMIAMTIAINEKNFPNRPAAVTCNTCHRGATHPVAQPVMPQPQPPFPTPISERPARPELKAIIDKYAAAIGDASKLASRRSKGERIGADGKTTLPIEIAERGHDRIHVKAGEAEQGINPEGGWARTPNGIITMNPDQLLNFRQLAEGFALVAPSEIPAEGRVGNRENVNDRPAWIVTASLREGVREKLWFDAENGLLVRRQILTKSPVGEIPLQTDYSDYRDAGGVKVPFTVRVSSIDPWIGSTRKLAEVKAGVAIEDGEFAKPKE